MTMLLEYMPIAMMIKMIWLDDENDIADDDGKDNDYDNDDDDDDALEQLTLIERQKRLDPGVAGTARLNTGKHRHRHPFHSRIFFKKII